MNEFDKEYFKDREFEKKHIIQPLIWDHQYHIKKALDIGCGLGHLVFGFDYCEINCEGCDLKEVIDLLPYTYLKEKFKIGDVRKLNYKKNSFDFVCCYDVLEHLEEKDIETALKELCRVTNKLVLISVPCIDNNDLYLDKTHKIFKSKEWWEYIVGKYFKLLPTPKHFLFSHQLLIGEKLWKN